MTHVGFALIKIVSRYNAVRCDNGNAAAINLYYRDIIRQQSCYKLLVEFYSILVDVGSVVYKIEDIINDFMAPGVCSRRGVSKGRIRRIPCLLVHLFSTLYLYNNSFC